MTKTNIKDQIETFIS